jgi:hypothetical protein
MHEQRSSSLSVFGLSWRSPTTNEEMILAARNSPYETVSMTRSSMLEKEHASEYKSISTAVIGSAVVLKSGPLLPGEN